MTEIVALQTHRAPERGRFKKTAKQKILFTELAQLLHCFSQNTWLMMAGGVIRAGYWHRRPESIPIHKFTI